MHSFHLFLALASFSMIILEIYHVECISILLLFVAGLYPIVWIYYNSFIHSPSDERLGCFQFCATINTASKNPY